MLWHKGWLETRWRLLFALAVVGLNLALLHFAGSKAPGPSAMPIVGMVGFAMIAAALVPATLAGSGIATQPSFQATKGVHGSTLFTVSLPVNRFRLLAVRAGIGWLEQIAVMIFLCGGMWIVFPALRSSVTPAEMLEQLETLVACGSALYFIPVLFATFLDDITRMWASFVCFAALWWFPNHTPFPVAANIFGAMSDGSPLIAHTMPWPAMAFSLGLSAMLFFAALRIVRVREY